MISIKKTKFLLKNRKISDEEAERIRNDLRSLAEIVVEVFINQEIRQDLKEKLNNENVR